MKFLDLEMKRGRKERGWSQEDLARAVGVSRVSIGGYESGHQVPSLDVALAISRELGFSLDKIIVRTNAKVMAERKKERIARLKEQIKILEIS